MEGFTNLSCLEIESKVDAADIAAATGPGEEGTALGSMMGDFTSSVPGFDEISAFMAMMKTASDSKYSCVVFDTAPTGER